MNCLYHIGEIRNKLCDNKSKELFDLRLNYFMNRDLTCLNNKIVDVNELYWEDDLEEYLKKYKNFRICIWGCGNDGLNTYKILSKMNKGYNVTAFCDNNEAKWKGKTFCSAKVINLEELMEHKDDYIVIIATERYVSAVYEQLLFRRFPREQIYYPISKHLVCNAGNQYFDLEELKVDQNEVFVDAGSYDGNTSVAFANWCDNRYHKIYAFEPHPISADICKKTFQSHGLERIELINAGTWSEETNLLFNSKSSAGSGITNKGDILVPVTSIDKVCKDRVTFIKMDVEGSELESLKGAYNVIRKHHPKLAISIYHKPEDVITIPYYIMQLSQDYQFYIRHYASNYWETVLYAI